MEEDTLQQVLASIGGADTIIKLGIGAVIGAIITAFVAIVTTFLNHQHASRMLDKTHEHSSKEARRLLTLNILDESLQKYIEWNESLGRLRVLVRQFSDPNIELDLSEKDYILEVVAQLNSLCNLVRGRIALVDNTLDLNAAIDATILLNGTYLYNHLDVYSKSDLSQEAFYQYISAANSHHKDVMRLFIKTHKELQSKNTI